MRLFNDLLVLLGLSVSNLMYLLQMEFFCSVRSAKWLFPMVCTSFSSCKDVCYIVCVYSWPVLFVLYGCHVTSAQLVLKTDLAFFLRLHILWICGRRNRNSVQPLICTMCRSQWCRSAELIITYGWCPKTTQVITVPFTYASVVVDIVLWIFSCWYVFNFFFF